MVIRRVQIRNSREVIAAMGIQVLPVPTKLVYMDTMAKLHRVWVAHRSWIGQSTMANHPIGKLIRQVAIRQYWREESQAQMVQTVENSLLMTHRQMDIRTAEGLMTLALALALALVLDCNLLIIHESNHSMHMVQHIDRNLQLVEMDPVVPQAPHRQMLLMDSEIYSNCHLAYVWSDVTQCDRVKVCPQIKSEMRLSRVVIHQNTRSPQLKFHKLKHHQAKVNSHREKFLLVNCQAAMVNIQQLPDLKFHQPHKSFHQVISTFN